VLNISDQPSRRVILKRWKSSYFSRRLIARSIRDDTKLKGKKVNEKILYVFLAILLCSASLKMSLTYGIMNDSYFSQASHISNFSSFESSSNETFMIDEWRREIRVNDWGAVSGSDYYSIFNNRSEDILQLTFILPANASDISIQDAYGDYSKTMIVTSVKEDYIQVDLTLREPLKSKERNEFLITYSLPSSRYITQKSWQEYTLNLNLVKPEKWFVKKFSLIIFLPEGAGVKSFSNANYKVEKQGLSVKIVLTEYNLIEFPSSQVTLEYQYFILWGILRPLGLTALVVLVGGAFFFIRRFMRPKVAVTPVSTSILRKFVEVYEEKRRLLTEIESLQRQFRSGKLSRKRLRIRRRSVEQRLTALNKRLTELKDQMVALADRYGEMLKELETAEAEIETLNADIERVEARFRRGEISADVRRRLLDEYNRIKRRAESTISEIILRLQEESV